jgi:hypothetical protein
MTKEPVRWAGGTAFGQRLAVLVRARWPQLAIFLCALFAIDLIRHHSYRGWSVESLLGEGYLAIVLGITFVVGGASVAGILFAEALGRRGSARVMATVGFAVAGAALALGGIAVITPAWLDTSWDQGSVPVSAFLLRNLWYYPATSVLLSAFFAMRERDLEVTRAAQAAELERGRAQRIVMESRLKVLQARVEPELLFDVLTDVQRRYSRNPAEAEALLDHLIVYLRAALPQMRGDSSTLSREVALAQAFLNVTPAGRAGRLSFSSRIADELEDIPFPPMVLLPLVHAAADAQAAGLQIETRVLDERPPGSTLRVRVVAAADDGVPGWQGEPLAALREIVRGYFGEEATLETIVIPEGVAATITFRVNQPVVGRAAEQAAAPPT